MYVYSCVCERIHFPVYLLAAEQCSENSVMQKGIWRMCVSLRMPTVAGGSVSISIRATYLMEILCCRRAFFPQPQFWPLFQIFKLLFFLRSNREKNWPQHNKTVAVSAFVGMRDVFVCVCVCGHLSGNLCENLAVGRPDSIGTHTNTTTYSSCIHQNRERIFQINLFSVDTNHEFLFFFFINSKSVHSISLWLLFSSNCGYLPVRMIIKKTNT